MSQRKHINYGLSKRVFKLNQLCIELRRQLQLSQNEKTQLLTSNEVLHAENQNLKEQISGLKTNQGGFQGNSQLLKQIEKAKAQVQALKATLEQERQDHEQVQATLELDANWHLERAKRAELQVQEIRKGYEEGIKLRDTILSQAGSLQQIISTYHSSSYFHVGPRYQMLNFCSGLISRSLKWMEDEDRSQAETELSEQGTRDCSAESN